MIPKSELGQLELDDGVGGFDKPTDPQLKPEQLEYVQQMNAWDKGMIWNQPPKFDFDNGPEGIETYTQKVVRPNKPPMTPEQAADWHKQNAVDPFSPEQLALVKKLGTYEKEQAIFDSIERELHHATKKHGPFNSGHEGWAVIQEEVDELWEAVKRNSKNSANREAVQVAAMAVRFILDNK